MAAILFRNSQIVKNEMEYAAKYFKVHQYRTLCHDDLIIGRYSVLPFYREVETDLANNNCGLINSYQEHNWIASFDWYNDLKNYTPTTYSDKQFYKWKSQGPFVLKGATTSKKHQWSTCMFAANRAQAMQIASNLANDMMIGEQDIFIREYVPLKTYEIGINGLPFTNEWRFFYYQSTLLTYGYYWSCAEVINRQLSTDGLQFADMISKIVSEFVSFYVIDIAETEDGNWILIEINDGQMSGLSECDPDQLYKNLSSLNF